MTWVRRVASSIVRALLLAQAEDESIEQGFERRVVEVLERERPVVDASVWDRPSEVTVRVPAVRGAEALAQRQGAR